MAGRDAILAEARAALARGDCDRAADLLQPLADAAGADALAAGLLRARALRAGGRLSEAIEALQPVLVRADTAGDAPTAAAVLAQLGLISHRLGTREDAATLLAQALALAPALPEAAAGLARLHAEAEDFDAARAVLDEALAHTPASPDLLNTRGAVLADAGLLAEAEASLRQALETAPRLGEAWSNLGNVLRDRGRIEDATACYEQALALLPEGAPDYPRARVNRGMARLIAGDFTGGWEDYEWRLRLPEARETRVLPPPWTGDPLPGGTLLLYPEQGVGDVVMFATLLPEIQGRVGHVIVWAPERLEALLARSLPDCTVIADPGPAARCDSADVSLALGSLPRFLRPDADAFAGTGPTAARPFLIPDAGKRAAWRKRLTALTGGAPAVGIAWRGGASHWDRTLRTSTAENWKALLALPDRHWVSLQYGMTEDERAAFEALAPDRFHAFADTGADLDAFAALVAALDLVVSMDNSTVHVAAALGRPVVTLVPEVPTWRWGLAGTRTPWYPTMELVRRNAGTPWQDVISGLAPEVATLAGKDWHGQEGPL